MPRDALVGTQIDLFNILVDGYFFGGCVVFGDHSDWSVPRDVDVLARLVRDTVD